METNKKSLVKFLHVRCILLTMMLIINNSMFVNGHPKGAEADSASFSAAKWHPKMFYFILPDLNLYFRLPHEPDQSGVHNLFFISKETGEILLPDNIKENKRYFTPFSPGSSYDVVLLYNNGKYVKCNDIIFENGLEVDMRNQPIQPVDPVSEQWKKTLRAFDDAIADRESDSHDRTESKYVTKGYVFSVLGSDIVSASGYPGNVDIGDESIKTASDGYFEFGHKEDTEQPIFVSGEGLHVHIIKPNIEANSGLIVVLPMFGAARKTPPGRTDQKWHPEMFYFILPDLSMSFRLPHEPDQSGVHNLLFISKKSGEVLLPDTMKGNERYFTPFLPGSSYDVVLLYNNGKYVKCNDIILENGLEVDMQNQPVKPSNSASEQWKKTFRAFDYNTAIDSGSNKYDRTGLKSVTKGYVFSSLGNNILSASKYSGYVRIGNKWTETDYDGYFEYGNKEDDGQSLYVGGVAHNQIEKPNITVNSGLILVLPVSGKAKKETSPE